MKRKRSDSDLDEIYVMDVVDTYISGRRKVKKRSIVHKEVQGPKRGEEFRRYYIYMLLLDTSLINPENINNPNVVGDNVMDFRDIDYQDSIDITVPNTLAKIGHTSQKLSGGSELPRPLKSVHKRIKGSFNPYKIRPFLIHSPDNSNVYKLEKSIENNFLDKNEKFRRSLNLTEYDDINSVIRGLSIWEVSQTYIHQTANGGPVLNVVKHLEALIRYNCAEQNNGGRYARYGGGKEWIRFQNRDNIRRFAEIMADITDGDPIDLEMLRSSNFWGLPDPSEENINWDSSDESEEFDRYLDFW